MIMPKRVTYKPAYPQGLLRPYHPDGKTATSGILIKALVYVGLLVVVTYIAVVIINSIR